MIIADIHVAVAQGVRDGGTLRPNALAADDVDGASLDDNDRHQGDHAFQHHKQSCARRYRQGIRGTEGSGGS